MGILLQINTGPSARFHVRCSLLWFLFTCLILYNFRREFKLNFIGRPQRYCKLRSRHHDKASIAMKGDTKIFWLPQACEHFIHTTLKFTRRARVICLNNQGLFQFSCLCPTLCDPMDCSTPSFPVHHHFPVSTQTHVHRVGDAIQPSHPLSSPSPPALNLSQHQGLFK